MEFCIGIYYYSHGVYENNNMMLRRVNTIGSGFGYLFPMSLEFIS